MTLKEVEWLYEKQLHVMESKKNAMVILLKLQSQRLDFLQNIFLEYLPLIKLVKEQKVNAASNDRRRKSI